jgi:putative phosphoesterase
MRLLILSDVHGNLAALKAVLAAEPSPDGIVFLGDAVDYGPDPGACLALLEGLCLVRIRGNHDNAVARGVDCACSEAFHHLSVASREFTRRVLGATELDALGRLPTEAALSFGGVDLYLTHASPRDNLFDYASPDREGERWIEAMNMAPGDADAILAGHTHRPYVQPLGRRTVVNPGSVGQPRDGDPRASYATWEDGRFGLRRVEYDVEHTVRRLGETGMEPEVIEALAGILRQGGLP